MNTQKRVYISRKHKGDTQRYIAVNGENILVQTDRSVELPSKFAEIISESERLDGIAERYIRENAN